MQGECSYRLYQRFSFSFTGLMLKFVFFLLELRCTVLSLSALQQSDPVIHTHRHPFPRLILTTIHHKGLEIRRPVLYGGTSSLLRSKRNRLHLPTPNWICGTATAAFFLDHKAFSLAVTVIATALLSWALSEWSSLKFAQSQRDAPLPEWKNHGRRKLDKLKFRLRQRSQRLPVISSETWICLGLWAF